MGRESDRVLWRRSAAEKSWYGLTPAKACWLRERQSAKTAEQAELNSDDVRRVFWTRLEAERPIL